MKDIESVAIYARVSTDKQRARQTIDSQLSTLPVYAKEHGYSVYKTYRDDGISGSSIAARPAFTQLLEDCTKGLFQGILVVEHNRLTRSDNPEEVGKISRIFMENDIKIVSPPEGILDLKKPPDELVAWIKMWISKEERKEIRRKIGRGRIESWKKGRWASGKYPLGYRKKEKGDEGDFCCAIDEEKRDLYRWIVDRFHDDRWSLSKIVKGLKERGVSTSHAGRQWYSVSLNFILKNTCYKGYLDVNKNRPKAEWLKLTFPRLISDEKWQAIQDRLAKNENVGRPAKGNFLLRSLVRCGHCHYRLFIAQGSRPDLNYYLCPNRAAASHIRKTENGERCPLPYLRSKDLDDLVFQRIVQFLWDRSIILDQVFSDSAQRKQLEELEKQQKQFKWEVGRHRERQDRLMGLFVDGNYDRKLLDKKSAEIDKQLEGSQVELNRVEKELRELQELKNKRDLIETKLRELKGDGFAEFLKNKMHELPFDDKLKLVRSFFPGAKDEILVFQEPGFFPIPKKRGKLPDNLILQWKGMLDVGLLERTLREIKVGKVLKNEEDDVNENMQKSQRNIQVTGSWIVSHRLSSCSGPSPFW